MFCYFRYGNMTLICGTFRKRVGFGSGSLGEEGADGVWEGLICVFEQEGDLPDLGWGQGLAVGRHGGLGDAIFDLGVGFAWGNGGDRGSLAPELGGDGVEGPGGGGFVAGGAMATGTVLGVEPGSGLEDVLADAKGRLLDGVGLGRGWGRLWGWFEGYGFWGGGGCGMAVVEEAVRLSWMEVEPGTCGDGRGEEDAGEEWEELASGACSGTAG